MTTTTAEKIAIMQASEEGEVIQATYGQDWGDIIPRNWNWGDLEYRIKPELKYDWTKVPKDSLITVNGRKFHFSHCIGDEVFYFRYGASSTTNVISGRASANYRNCEVIELNTVENSLIAIAKATSGSLEITHQYGQVSYFELDGYIKG